MSSTPSTPSSPYVDELGRCDAEVYLTGIYDGDIVASKYMRRLAEIMLPRFHEEYHGYHFDVEKALRPVQFIERFCVIPEGNKMWQPFLMEQFQKACIELAYGFVDENRLRQFQQIVYCLGRKNGKALSLDTEIATPNGWRQMRDIHPGDYVFGQDGSASMVLAESDVFNDRDMYLVTFEDGATVKASGDHLWTVQSKKSKKACSYKHKTSVRFTSYRPDGWYEATTSEIAESYARVRRDGKGCEYFYRIPMSMPVEYDERDLPIDPYVFGAWIGDGTSSKPQITIGAKDERDMVFNLSYRGHVITEHIYPSMNGRGAKTYDIDHHVRDGKNGPFKQKLINLGVLNNKHIPDIYLQCSIEQRWELLRGLMDTDGYVSKVGECQFTQKSKIIAEQFVELCSSLGIKANMRSKEAKCNGKPAGTVYVVNFFTDKTRSCFLLRRKHNRLKDKLAPRMSCKSIVSVERIPTEPCKCITIDNDSHLYLAGRQYTATHNSSLIGGLGLFHLTSDGELGGEVYCCATTEPQARKVLGAADSMAFHSQFLKGKIRRGTAQKTGRSALNYDRTGSLLAALSSAPLRGKDGLSCSALIYDELAAVEDNGALLDNLEESMSARRQPITWILSSENYIRDGIWDERISYCHGILDGSIEDDTVLPLLYTQDDRSEIIAGLDDPTHSVWLKSNPGLFVIKDADRLAQRVRQAKQSPRRLPSVITKEFCLRSGGYSSFLDSNDCINQTEIDFGKIGIPPYVCLGLDVAVKYDLCSCVARWKVPGDDRIYEIAKFWVASDVVNLQADVRQKDKVPYLLWSSQGQMMGDTTWHYVDIVEGDRVGIQPAIDFMNDLVNEGMYPYCIGYDPWHVGFLEQDMLKRFVGESRSLPVPPTMKAISPLVREHELDLKAHRVVCPNPCLHHNRSSVQVREDPQGNVQVQKKDLQPHQKIDGFMAELYSLAAYNKFRDGYLSAIGWDDHSD